MQNQIKPRAVSRFFKARYLIGVWIAAELLTLPAAAQVMHRVAFKVEPHVIAEQIPTQEAGLTHFVVSSNAPFSVTASGMIGELGISVSESGTFGALSYGSAAQLPGVAEGCAMLLSASEVVVYRATQRTAARRGDAVEQAVIMTFTHHPSVTPTIRFTVEDSPIIATECEARRVS